jgi:hypothetical protein
VPQVEAEYAQLNRDYDIVRKNYDQMVARRESASLGVKLDESSQLAEFRVIEPPRVSETPVFPRRLHVAAGAIALSALAGLAAGGRARSHPADAGGPAHAARAQRAAGARRGVRAGDAARPAQAAHGPARLRARGGALLLLQGAWIAWLATRPPVV